MDPRAAQFANYNGDVRHMIGQVVGPNTMGEYLTAVDAEYDATANRTRVGFRYTQIGDKS